MIVDFHVHTFPDAFAARTVAALSRVSRTRPFTDGTAAALQASMKRAGVDRSVLLPVATKPAQVPGINDAAAQINSREEGGLLSFGGIHPEFADWRAELTRIAALGIPASSSTRYTRRRIRTISATSAFWSGQGSWASSW